MIFTRQSVRSGKRTAAVKACAVHLIAQEGVIVASLTIGSMADMLVAIEKEYNRLKEAK